MFPMGTNFSCVGTPEKYQLSIFAVYKTCIPSQEACWKLPALICLFRNVKT